MFRLILLLLLLTSPTALKAESPIIHSSWIEPSRIMVIHNTVKMDSVDPTEADTFSRDIATWYMKAYGMPDTHLFPYDMGKKVRWNHPGAYDFLQAVADYIEQNQIQIVLLAPGTPLIIRDINNKADLALDSLAGHALWFAKIKKEAPTCNDARSIAPDNCNLYFPYQDMGDGASPFVTRTKYAKTWCPDGGSLIGERQWYQSTHQDLRDHPSVRPFGRIGLPYYLEAFPGKKTGGANNTALDIPLENSTFVKKLVTGGIAAATSIQAFNQQAKRSLLFYGRENNTASFIDVESALCEAMAQDAIQQGLDPARIVRISPRSGSWNPQCCLNEPQWDYTNEQFQQGSISPAINPLIFAGGGVGNITEASKPWPKNLNVQPGLLATASVSNGKAFSGSLLRRGATTMIVNLHHPQNSRLHGWFDVFRQIIDGSTVAEAMISAGGSERGGYITGSIWGDPLYAPFGKNKNKTQAFIGERR